MKKHHIWLVAALLWCIIIFVITELPASTGSETKGILAFLFGLEGDALQTANYVMRKSVHLGSYGLMAFLFFMCLRRKRFLLAWLFTTIYACIDEWHQVYVPNRTGALGDVMIDSIGAFTVLTVIYLIIRTKAWIK